MFSFLPLELVQEIFLQCLPSPLASVKPEVLYHSLDVQGGTPQTAPLLLCQVCHQWRQLALGLPRLWASLDVFVSMGKARPPLPLASLWLDRACAVPLSLSLHQQNESSANRIAAGELLDLFKEHIAHWGSIHLDLAAPTYCKLLTAEQRAAPYLKEFRMEIRGGEMPEDENLYGILQYVPRLCRLHVSRIPDLNLFGGTVLPIPWPQLQSLSLDYVPSIVTAFHILQHSPNLMEANFKVDSVAGPPPTDPICHPLASLTLNIGHEELPAFLEHVSLPGLKGLTIHVRGPLEPYGWPQNSLEQFLKRSGCHLSRFEVHDTGMKCHEFAACLKNEHLQRLVELVVEDRRGWTWDPFVTNFALGLLTTPGFLNGHRGEGNPDTTLSDEVVAAALPWLERLSLRGSCIWTEDGSIADMVESRRQFCGADVRELKHLEIEVPSSNTEDLRRLRELESGGLDLQLIFRQ